MTDLRNGACVGLPLEQSEALFFGESWAERLEGIRMCNACPVVGLCLDAALALEHAGERHRSGTWGGLIAKDREYLARALARAVS